MAEGANASASADAGPARLVPIKGFFAGKVWLINQAVGIRLHAVVGPPFIAIMAKLNVILLQPASRCNGDW